MYVCLLIVFIESNRKVYEYIVKHKYVLIHT